MPLPSVGQQHRHLNDSIPGFKSTTQLEVMSQLIRKLGFGAKIVELGSCAGRGTWTISKSAPLFAKVYAIDLWSEKNVFYGNGFNLDPSKQSTMEYFLEQIKGCSNVIPIQGDAIDVPFSKKADCLIIDCDRGRDQNDYMPLWKRWHPLLKKKSLVIGTNYLPANRPDEVAFAHVVRDSFDNLQHESGIWWSFKK